MAQKGSGKRKQAPAYSAGLALIALGAVIFMAVELRLQGNIFEGLRRICFGLCGILAYVLPVLPLWAGGLVIWSTQRKAPVKPWLFAFGAFLGLCALIMVPGVEFWDRNSDGSWVGVIQEAFGDGADRLEVASGGGGIGAAIAWPLWKVLGSVLGALILFALTVFCGLLAANLTPSRLRDLLTGQAGKRKQQAQAEREWAEQQQLAWQQQQAAQQLAWQQQQAQIIEQQQQYMQRPAAQQPAMAPEPVRRADDGGVANWQEQLAAGQTAAAAPGHQSRIFTRKDPEKPVSEDRSFRSRIFGRKKEEYDGLSDGTALAAQKAAQQRKTAASGEDGTGPDSAEQDPAAVRGRPLRRTVNDELIAAPQTRWASARRDFEEETEPETDSEKDLNAARSRQRRTPAAEEQFSRRGRDPEPVAQAAPDRDPEALDSPARKPDIEREDGAFRGSAASGRTREDAYRRPADPGKVRKDVPAVSVAPAASAAPVVPVVQQEIGREAYKPDLKLPPRAEEVRSEEDDLWTPTPYNYPPITDLDRGYRCGGRDALPPAGRDSGQFQGAGESGQCDPWPRHFPVRDGAGGRHKGE